MSFVYQINGRQALKIDAASDLTLAALQLEYMKKVEAKTYERCANACLMDMSAEDLKRDEKVCLNNCTDKMMAYYEQFYSQISVMQALSMAKKKE